MLSMALVAPLLAFVNIMPFGDSITSTCHDSADFQHSAYRVMLQDDLQSTGTEFDFVGPNANGCVADGYDPNHAGYSGYRLEQLVDLAPVLAEEYSPDMVFLLAGTNNHFSLPDMTFFRDQYSALFDAFGDRPLYVATVPPFGYNAPDISYWTKEFVDHRNQVMFPLMNRVIRELAAERPNVRVVEYAAAIDPEIHLTQDQVHPNRIGQQILADLFWAAAFEFDFDRSGLLEPSDVNLLSEAIRQGSSDLRYDVDRNGLVDGLDRVSWLRQYGRSYTGDANLDGYFNSMDILLVLQSGQYETSEQAFWQSGDWNGDGEFNSADLVTALASGAYERAVPAVPIPEPCTAAGWFSWTLILLGHRSLRTRRRKALKRGTL